MPRNVRPPGGRGTARQLRSTNLNDFTGGLNLSDDLFKVPLNQSPDLLNLDVHSRGGLVTRGGMRARTEPTIGEYVRSDLFRFKTPDGVEASALYAIVDRDGALAAVPTTFGAAVSSLGLGVDNLEAEDGIAAVQMNDFTFYLSKRYGLRRGTWDGNTLNWGGLFDAAVTGGWGTASNLPRGLHAAVFDNRLWVADTLEDGVNHRSRLRFSNDGDPNTFEAENFIDVDLGEDGDCIEGIVVHGEFLVVFKRRATYVVTTVADEFLYQVIDLSRSAGVSSPLAAVSTQYGLMFWDGRLGLHAWNQGQPQPIGERIVNAIHDRRIDYDADVVLSWVNERVWCSVVLDGQRQVLVFDPRLAAWVRYLPDVERVHRVGQEMWGFSGSLGRWLEVERRDLNDNFGDVTSAIEAYWTSPWIHGGSHVLPKRWRRPRFVLASTNGGEAQVSVRSDLDPRSNVRQFDLNLPRVLDGALWAGAIWGETPLGLEGAEYSQLIQGPAIGNFESIQFRVDGPTDVASRWRLDAVTATYIPKNVRS